MNESFLDAVAGRRSIYSLGKEKTISHERVEGIVKTAVTHVPSAFNSQSSRTLLLFDEQSGDFWEIVKDSLKKIIPAADFGKTAHRIACGLTLWVTVLVGDV